MQYVRLIGGLGNQLFQYAFALNLLKKNKSVKLDDNSFKIYKTHPNSIKKFKLKIKFANWEDVQKFYLLNSKFISIKILIFSKFIYSKLINIFSKKYIFEEIYNYKKNYKKAYFHGYWQDMNYLNKNYKILKSIKLKKYTKKHLKLIKEIKNKRNAVAIHVRYYPKKYQKHHINLDSKYYNNAIKLLRTKIKQPFFYIFSSDISKVTGRIDLSMIDHKIVKNFHDYEDLISISKCNHQIISNSTFSLWGAWLNIYNSKIVIAPKKWFLNKKIKKYLIPSGWIKI